MIIPFDKSKYDYSTEEILENITGSRLLSAEIEFNRSCNYLCPYCYAAGNSDHAQLDPAVATDAIRQVHALGARKIVVLGGEPLLCKQLKANIELITGELGMGAEIFTNGALINEDWAKFFFEHGCRVVVKLNSLRPEVQERLTGVPNALDKAFHAIRVLKDAGFDSEMLVASSVISAENEQEVAELWKYLRRNGIKPYLEIMTPQGRLLENRDLEVHPRRLKEIFDEIAAFDNANGYDWEPQPPLVGSKCLRHLYSCVIGATGNVTPCVGLTEVLGNIYERKLSDILGTSVVLRKLKDFRNTIKGPCKTCEKADSCYGCRGAVYQLTGDYLASDPLCWKNCDTLLDQPYPLPCDAQQWLPHRPPMTMVDELIEFGEWTKVTARIKPDNRFLRDGVLDNEALPEIVAQACAVMTGFERNDHDLGGFLTGLRSIRFLHPVRSGDLLILQLHESGHVDNYHTLDFKAVLEDGPLCAEGELSICEI